MCVLSGTPYYQSPEQVTDSYYNTSSDIWSLGCLLYECCSLSPPFHANTHFQLAVKIQSGQYDRIPIQYSDTLELCIRSMIQLNSDRRPTCQQLLQLTQLQSTQQSLNTIHPSSNNNTQIQLQQLQKLQLQLDIRDKQLQQREQLLDEREFELNQREIKLNTQQQASSMIQYTRMLSGDELKRPPSTTATIQHYNNNTNQQHNPSKINLPLQPALPTPFTKLSNITNSTNSNTINNGANTITATIHHKPVSSINTLGNGIAAININLVPGKSVIQDKPHQDKTSPRLWEYT